MEISDKSSRAGEVFEMFKKSNSRKSGSLFVDNVVERVTGANTPMSFVDVKYGIGEIPHEAKMVVRKAYIFNMDVFIGDEKEDMTESERYYSRWRYLKDRGIPTLNSMRIIDDDRVVMGDATVDGSEFFGKGKRKIIAEELENETERKLTSKEQRFLEIMQSGELAKEVERVIKLMKNSELCFPLDDEYDVIIHNDGTFQVLVMDLSLLDKGQEDISLRDVMAISVRLYGGLLKLSGKSTTIDV